MASAVIHLCVAKKINEKLKMNEKELFLGSIAPDISKQVNEPKTKSHFLTSSEEDIPNVFEFLDKYKDKLYKPFNMGYFIHLYTDKIWFAEFLRSKYYDKFIKLIDGTVINVSQQEKLDIIYNDYTNLNVYLLDKYDLDLSLFYEKFVMPNTDIDEIPVDKLQILLDKMGLIIMNSKEKKAYIFDDVAINKFIDYCTDKILRKIKEYNIKSSL